MESLRRCCATVFAGLLCVSGCSGAGQESRPSSGAVAVDGRAASSAGTSSGGAAASTPAPPAPALAQGASSLPAQGAGSVPAAAAEGRPGGATPPPRAPGPDDATVALRQEIERLIGDAACRDDGQCRALPLGAKPCGGPEAYVAWSTARTDARQLEAAAARYKEARGARNQRLGLVSDCSVVPEPPVRCVPAAGSDAGGRCQAAVARGGPQPAMR